jgi:hypothetical protein
MRAEVQQAFDSRCAYLGHWISSGQVDHFKPKALFRADVYEWSNYRWCEARANLLKNKKPDFLDPYQMQLGWMEIDSVTLEFSVTDALPANFVAAAAATLEVLNDKELVRGRQRLADGYQRTFAGQREALLNLMDDQFPLLAQSWRRDGLP